MKINYTEEQLIRIKNNMALVSLNAINVLKAIHDEPGISNNEVAGKSNLSKFVADKCIAAFLVCGLIIRIDDGVKRFYKLTEDGNKILDL